MQRDPAARPSSTWRSPVHNEEAGLERCVRRLHAHLTAAFPYPFRITIADNASTDGTWSLARTLATELPRVKERARDNFTRLGAIGGKKPETAT